MSSPTCLLNIVIASVCDESRADRLQRACNSVRAMAGDHSYAIIVVANGNRVSPTVLTWLRARSDIRLVQVRTGSYPLARRVGVEMADAEFLGFVDDDDELLPNTLGKKLAYFRAHPDVDVLISDGLRVNGSATSRILPRAEERGTDVVDTMMRSGWSACSLTLRTKNIDLAAFDSEFRQMEWTLTALQLARHHKVGLLDEPMFCYYEDTPNSLSKSVDHELAAPEVWRRLSSQYAGTPYEKTMRHRYRHACHNASWQHARLGNLREAWRLHWQSMQSPGGLKAYLPYSRKLLLASLRRTPV